MDRNLASALRQQLLDHDDRDCQLWSIVILAFFAVGAGFASLFLPTILWGLEIPKEQGTNLPQLTVGFIILIILFSIYVIGQRRTLAQTRSALMEEVIRAEKARADSFVDPLTGVFNRRYLDYHIVREAQRVDRTGGVLSVLMVDVNNFKLVNTQFGHLEGDRFLRQVAEVLKGSFRKSDTVIRYGGDEFVVLLPDTGERGARRAVRRLLDEVAAWNTASGSGGLTMGLSCGTSCYTRGAEIGRVLELADQRMYDQKTCAAEWATVTRSRSRIRS